MQTFCFSLAQKADAWSADLETMRKALGYGNYSEFGGDLGYHEVSEFTSCSFVVAKPTKMPMTEETVVTTTERPTTEKTTEKATTKQATTEKATTQKATTTEKATTEKATTKQATTKQATTEQATTQKPTTEKATTIGKYWSTMF